jgi:hypothetical protein
MIVISKLKHLEEPSAAFDLIDRFVAKTNGKNEIVIRHLFRDLRIKGAADKIALFQELAEGEKVGTDLFCDTFSFKELDCCLRRQHHVLYMNPEGSELQIKNSAMASRMKEVLKDYKK